MPSPPSAVAEAVKSRVTLFAKLAKSSPSSFPPRCVNVRGWRQALKEDVHLRRGLNVHGGAVTYAAVAQDLGLAFHAAEDVIG